MEGEIEIFKNSTINKRVWFSRYQYRVNAPVLSEIDGSGPITYYNFIILLMFSK